MLNAFWYFSISNEIIFIWIRFKEKEKGGPGKSLIKGERVEGRENREMEIYIQRHTKRKYRDKDIDLEKLGNLQGKLHKERGRWRNREIHYTPREQEQHRENVQICMHVHARTHTPAQRQSQSHTHPCHSQGDYSHSGVLITKFLDTAGSKYCWGLPVG